MQYSATNPAPSTDRPLPDRDRLGELRQSIEHAAHLLPSQGPISVFVHHNTLHAYEDMPFTDALLKGMSRFGCEPYLSETRFRQELACGRITMDDISSILISDMGDEADRLLGFLGTRYALRRAMMRYSLRVGPVAELRWVIAETDALRQFRDDVPTDLRERTVGESRRWVMRDLRPVIDAHASGSAPPADRRLFDIVARVMSRFDAARIEQWSNETWTSFCLHFLWQVCASGVAQLQPSDPPKGHALRLRDRLLDATGEDPDRLVNEFLIPFCSVFLDQGLSHWPLPHRDEGFYRSFIQLYGHASVAQECWLNPLRAQLQRLRADSVSPLESIEQSLQALGVCDTERDDFVAETLLALRGFAGMIWQLETRGDRVARPAPKDTLIEFLAIRLILDTLALQFVARDTLSYRGTLSELHHYLARMSTPTPRQYDDQRAFLVFQLAQLMGWTPESLYRMSHSGWAALIKEIETFSDVERRRIFQLAYERKYLVQALDAIASQTAFTHSNVDRANGDFDAGNGNHRSVPVFQIICCIDDREESFRRHIEEVEPRAQTLSTAGFFAAAMYYRGNAEAHYVPLCPIIVRPQHFVQEAVALSFEVGERKRRRIRRAIGHASYQMHAGTRTMIGGLLAGLFGTLTTLPMVMRILFPRIAARIRRVCGEMVHSPPVTVLQIERTADPPGPDNGHNGFSVAEMANIVETVLRDVGLTNNFSRLVLLCGHGSSSLNNPHESAYNCGACAGARGGPNARAFAQMANDPRVRQLLAERQFLLPHDTVFVGALHNTCDDSVTYFDLARVPLSHVPDFEQMRQVIDAARARNAHERCRRFESAPLNLSSDQALRHVEGRAEDLSQARPEYNHATNALCLIGRRSWSRGLYLDRRAFLQSYDPAQDDDDQTILTRILRAVVPVCAGISLEYYFSTVDHNGWGAGNKLPHNIVSLLGVMEGALGDLKPGLYQQMVEIHEPLRLLFVIETSPQAMLRLMKRNEGIAQLCLGNWIQLATLDPKSSTIHIFQEGHFVPYAPTSRDLPVVNCSLDWYRGARDNLRFARIRPSVVGACRL